MGDEDWAGRQYVWAAQLDLIVAKQGFLEQGKDLIKIQFKKGYLYNIMQGGLRWKITGVKRCIWRLLIDIGT